MTVTDLQRVLIDLQTRLMQSQAQLEAWNVNNLNADPDSDHAYILANGVIQTSIEKVTALIKDLRV